jgi:bifunctional lysine-specific demethylase and histidyl-hydroxylase NO66
MSGVLDDRLGCDPSSFFRSVWDTAPAHLRPGDDRRAPLLDVPDLDQILSTRLLRYPDFRLTQGGVVVPISSYARLEEDEFATNSLIPDLDEIYRLVDGGATLVLQNVQRYWAPAQAICRELEELLAVPSPCTLFFTPGGARGLDRHADNYEGLVFQTVGSKYWRVYGRGADLALEATLAVGDVLYVPNGFAHEAVALDRPSIHLTYSLAGLTWRKLLAGLLDNPARDQLDALVPFDRDDELAGARQALTALVTWASQLEPDHLLTWQAERHPVSALPAGSPRLGGLLAAPTVSDDTRVDWVPGRCQLFVSGSSVVLQVADRQLEMPSFVGPALERLRDDTPLLVRKLDAVLDDESRLVLVRRLLAEGILQLHP